MSLSGGRVSCALRKKQVRRKRYENNVGPCAGGRGVLDIALLQQSLHWANRKMPTNLVART